MAALDNVRHEAFCQAYTTGETAGNAVKSYLSVYPESSYFSGANSAHDLLKNPEIGSRVQELQKTIERGVIRREIKHRTVRQEEYVRMYGRIVRSLEKREAENGGLDKEDAALLKEAREWMKQSAIEAGEWTERQEHTGKLGVFDASRFDGIPDEALHQMIQAWQEAQRLKEQAALPAPQKAGPEDPAAE